MGDEGEPDMAGFFQQLMVQDGYPPEMLFYKLTIPRLVGWTLFGIGVLSLIGWATTPASGTTEAPKKKKAPRRGSGAMRESPQDLINSGMSHLDEGEYAKAIVKFEQLLEIMDGAGMGRPNERVMILMLLARALLGDDKIPEAEERCQEAVAMLRRLGAPPSAFSEPNLVLAEIYFKMDRLQECESLCQKVIGTINPKKASSNDERDSLVYHLCSAYRQLAKVLVKQQKLEQAADNLRSGLKLAKEAAPSSALTANLVLELAATLIDLDRAPEADKMVEELLEEYDRLASRMDQTQAAGQTIDALVKALYLNFDRCRWTNTLEIGQKLRDQLTALLRIKSNATIKQIMYMVQTQLAATYREQILEMKDRMPADAPEVTALEEKIKELEDSCVAGCAEINCGAPLGNSKMLRCTMCTFKPSMRSYTMKIELKRQLPLKPGPHPYWLPAGALLEVHFENPRDPLAPLVSTRLVDHATVQARGRIELIQPLPFGSAPPQASATLKVAVYMYADSAKTKLLDVMQQYCRVGDDPNQYTPGFEPF